MTFTRNERTLLVSSKEEISRFHIRNFENGKSLGRKLHSQTPLEQPKIPGDLNFLRILMLSF